MSARERIQTADRRSLLAMLTVEYVFVMNSSVGLIVKLTIHLNAMIEINTIGRFCGYTQEEEDGVSSVAAWGAAHSRALLNGCISGEVKEA